MYMTQMASVSGMQPEGSGESHLDDRNVHIPPATYCQHPQTHEHGLWQLSLSAIASFWPQATNFINSCLMTSHVCK